MFKVLFANSNQKLTQMYSLYLKRHFELDSVQDGLSAIRKIKLNKPTLIVSDYNLPNLSGIGLLKYIRNHPDFFATPFLFLSDHADNTEALNFGANEWIDAYSAHPNLVIERIYYNLKINQYAR